MKRVLNIGLMCILLSGTVLASTVLQQVTGNITSGEFTVAWYSDEAESGYLRFGSDRSDVSKVVNDVRGPQTIDRLHVVKVASPGIVQNTEYFYSIQSGATIADNQGTFYTVRTAISQVPPTIFDFFRVSNVLKLGSQVDVTKDVVVIAKGIKNDTGDVSQPQITIYKKGVPDVYGSPYTQYPLNYANFRGHDGRYFLPGISSLISGNYSIEVSGWTADDGVGGTTTLNAAPAANTILQMDRVSFNQVIDTDPPLPVTGIIAVPGNNRVTFNWTASISPDQLGTRIVRNSSQAPQNPADGTRLYAGPDEIFVDTTAMGGTRYYYAFYAFDQSSNFAQPVIVTVDVLGNALRGTNFEDFEDALINPGQNYFGGWNFPYDDQDAPNNGNSFASAIYLQDGADGSARSMRLDYNLGSNYEYRFVGYGLQLTQSVSVDLSDYTGIEVYIKGDGHQLTLELESPQTVVVSYNHYHYDFGETSDTWTRYIIPFESFTQHSWGSAVDLLLVLRNLKSLQFKASSQQVETGWFAIDEIRLVTENITPITAVDQFSVSVESDDPLQFRLIWDTVLGAAGYRVLRKTGGSSLSETDGTLIYEGANLLVSDISAVLTTDVTYYYTIFAFDNHGQFASGKSTQIKVDSGGGIQLSSLSVSQNIYNEDQSVLLRDYDYVSRQLTLSVYVLSDLVSSSIVATLNVTGTVAKTITFNPTATENLLPVSVQLNAGLINTLKFKTTDWNGTLSAERTILLKVASASDAVQLKPGTQVLLFPMPYDPTDTATNGGAMDIGYHLTKEANVTLYMYNMIGQLVWRTDCLPGFDGGRGGYNEVQFNGQNAFGDTVGVGLYFIRIVVDQKVIGTGKFLVVR